MGMWVDLFFNKFNSSARKGALHLRYLKHFLSADPAHPAAAPPPPFESTLLIALGLHHVELEDTHRAIFQSQSSSIPFHTFLEKEQRVQSAPVQSICPHLNNVE